jgi:hypothetical protein
MDGTILSQGRFVSAGADTIVQIPSNADFMQVVNYTKLGVVGTANIIAVKSYWQRGMAVGTGVIDFHTNTTAAITSSTYTSGGFTLVDTSGNPLVAPVAVTNITNATSPVISTASTSGLIQNTTVVRVSATAASANNASNLFGIDFVIGTIVANTSFTLTEPATNPLATAPGVNGAITGVYRIVQYDPLFYPRLRYAVNITRAAQAVVSTNVYCNYVAGQLVRFSIPASAGMVELDGQTGTVVSVGATGLTFVVNIDTTTYTAFTFPTDAQMPGQLPQVIPVGEDTASALISLQPQIPLIAGSTSQAVNNANSGILSDSIVNTGLIGMKLGFTGVLDIAAAAILNGPAGAANDVIYWLAGKSTYGGL